MTRSASRRGRTACAVDLNPLSKASRSNRLARVFVRTLVPTLCVGIQSWTLCAPPNGFEGRHVSRLRRRRRASGLHSHAERGNEKMGIHVYGFAE